MTQPRSLDQQQLRAPLQILTVLPQQPLHLAAGLALLPLGRGDIEPGQAPELAEQGAVIGATAGSLPVDQPLGRHTGLKHPAPASQLLHRQSGPAGRVEDRAATAAQARPQTGQAADQHLPHGQSLRLGHQAMPGLMDGDAAESADPAGERLSQQMAATASEAGGINTEGAKAQNGQQRDPPGRDAQRRSIDRSQADRQHRQPGRDRIHLSGWVD